ncbi:MAG: NosD domain-containing protein [Candidatus Bathyarchaeota archaeon]|jgi:parallel beta-helix repeat protein|nr:NosD domain-containing protein [Candidatus Bathyarchaeota archaeon]
MREKFLPVAVFFILVWSISSVALLPVKVKAQSQIYIRADGSIEPSGTPVYTEDKVTYFLNGSLDGSIIVERDHILINGTGFMIKGDDTGRGITLVGINNVTVASLRIDSFEFGVWVNASSWVKILDSRISSNGNYGVWVGFSSDVTVNGNNITSNERGIAFNMGTKNSVITRNRVLNNQGGIGLTGTTASTVAYNHISGSLNGISLLFSANHNMVYRNNITSSYSTAAIQIAASAQNRIWENNIYSNSQEGILLDYSPNNSITANTVKGNKYGIKLLSSNGNTIYNNNFIDNSKNVVSNNSYMNMWDSGSELGGNYWSDYDGADSNRDGIGDLPLIIDAGNIDQYPLKGIFSYWNVTADHRLIVVSNSTIEQATYFETNSTLKMKVSNMTVDQLFGFCRVCVSENLMSPPYSVVIDSGSTVVLNFNGTLYYNGTHRWIYFAYPHSTHIVEIIPESSNNVIVLAYILVFLVVATCRRKKPTRLSQSPAQLPSSRRLR